MQRKRYSAEFKREAVKLAGQAGMVKRQVAEELGIHENLLRTWVRQFAAGKWEASPGTALKSACIWRQRFWPVRRASICSTCILGHAPDGAWRIKDA
jgi:transposase